MGLALNVAVRHAPHGLVMEAGFVRVIFVACPLRSLLWSWFGFQTVHSVGVQLCRFAAFVLNVYRLAPTALCFWHFYEFIDCLSAVGASVVCAQVNSVRLPVRLCIVCLLFV